MCSQCLTFIALTTGNLGHKGFTTDKIDLTLPWNMFDLFCSRYWKKVICFRIECQIWGNFLQMCNLCQIQFKDDTTLKICNYVTNGCQLLAHSSFWFYPVYFQLLSIFNSFYSPWKVFKSKYHQALRVGNNKHLFSADLLAQMKHLLSEIVNNLRF